MLSKLIFRSMLLLAVVALNSSGCCFMGRRAVAFAVNRAIAKTEQAIWQDCHDMYGGGRRRRFFRSSGENKPGPVPLAYRLFGVRPDPVIESGQQEPLEPIPLDLTEVDRQPTPAPRPEGCH